MLKTSSSVAPIFILIVIIYEVHILWLYPGTPRPLHAKSQIRVLAHSLATVADPPVRRYGGLIQKRLS
jgi:hypothetical protein